MSDPAHPYWHPKYFAEGMKVLIPWPAPDKPRQGLWCTVTKAAGNDAYVENTERNVARWVNKYACYVERDSPAAGTPP